MSSISDSSKTPFSRTQFYGTAKLIQTLSLSFMPQNGRLAISNQEKHQKNLGKNCQLKLENRQKNRQLTYCLIVEVFRN